MVKDKLNTFLDDFRNEKTAYVFSFFFEDDVVSNFLRTIISFRILTFVSGLAWLAYRISKMFVGVLLLVYSSIVYWGVPVFGWMFLRVSLGFSGKFSSLEYLGVGVGIFFYTILYYVFKGYLLFVLNNKGRFIQRMVLSVIFFGLTFSPQMLWLTTSRFQKALLGLLDYNVVWDLELFTLGQLVLGAALSFVVFTPFKNSSFFMFKEVLDDTYLFFNSRFGGEVGDVVKEEGDEWEVVSLN